MLSRHKSLEVLALVASFLLQDINFGSTTTSTNINAHALVLWLTLQIMTMLLSKLTLYSSTTCTGIMVHHKLLLEYTHK